MDKKEKQFVIETSTKALISFIPLIGGAIGSILSDVLAERKEQRMQEFLSQLSKDLEGHKNQVNKDFVSKIDFVDVFEKTSRRIIDERSENKRTAYKNIILNGVISTIPNYDTIERYLFIMDQLFDDHIVLLKLFYNFKNELSDSEFAKDLEKHITGSYMRVFKSVLPEWSDDNIRFLIQDLEKLQLIDVVSDNLRAMTGVRINHLKELITSKGENFVSFILDPRFS